MSKSRVKEIASGFIMQHNLDTLVEGHKVVIVDISESFLYPGSYSVVCEYQTEEGHSMDMPIMLIIDEEGIIKFNDLGLH